VRQPAGAVLPGIAPSNVYPTADGEWVLIGANQDTVFGRLAEVLGRPSWVEPGAQYSTHLGRGAAQERLDAEISQWTVAHSADEVLARLQDGGVPCGRIYTARDIAGDPHYAAREMIVEVPEPALAGETVPMPGIVPKLSATPGALTRGGPLLGEHNREILEPLADAALRPALRLEGVA
jgi:formyl-CoA transferase/succinyl-CoA--D-citramalate CoA-transferase